MSYKGIMFDLDGTLVDTIYDLTDALNETMAYYGFPQASYEQGKRWIGNGLRRFIERALPQDQKNDDLIDEALLKMKENYRRRWVNKTRVYPGIHELLKICNDKNIPVGVNSNKPQEATAYILETLLPDITFAEILGHRDGLKHKPDPAGAFLVAQKMGLDPSQILYLGDSITDIETADNAGMMAVLVDYGYGDVTGYERTIDDPIKALNYLEVD